MDKGVEYTKEEMERDRKFAYRTQDKVREVEKVFEANSDILPKGSVGREMKRSLGLAFESFGFLKCGTDKKEVTKESGISMAKDLEKWAAQLAKEFGDNELVEKTLAASRDIKKDIKDTYGEKSLKKDTLSL